MPVFFYLTLPAGVLLCVWVEGQRAPSWPQAAPVGLNPTSAHLIMNVFTYIRVSGKSQLDGDGPERQRDAITRFSLANDLQSCGEFFEQISGTVEGVDRPQFSEMLSYIDVRGNIKAIVVERMDRLARDLMVSEVLLAELRRRNIQVFAADQGAMIDMASDGGDPTRVLIRQIMGALAQWEKSQLVKKLKIARDRAKEKTGRCGGTKPYGSFPGEKQVLQFIDSMRLQGLSLEKISKCLNDGDFKNRNGKNFSRQSLESIMNTQKKGK